MNKLGRLEKIPLREFWKHEALDYTQWLAKEENIQLLSDEIGIQIVEVKAEVNIGGYSVDLVGVDEDSGDRIVIENQLEQTDHKHLGQLVTYAAGYNASIVIWIVKNAREEHDKAIEWLNNHTGSELSFFLIKMELWRIGDSDPAPKFNILVEPNDWAKTLQQNQTEDRELTQTKLNQLEFWSGFKEYAQNNSSKLRVGRKPRAQHWYNISFGTSEAILSLTIIIRENQLGCDVYIPNSPSLYTKFLENKDAIDKASDDQLIWMPLEDKQASRIKAIKENANLNIKDNWKQYYDWFLNTAENMQTVFSKYT